MRNLKRTLRVAALLTVLSLVAATSGTLAWFQINRTATISFSEATVRVASASMQVNFKHSFNTMTSEKVSFSQLKLNAATRITDISGDGVKLYQPVWSGTLNTIENGGDGMSEYKVTQINDVTPRKPNTNGPGDPGFDADGYFIDFTITISTVGIVTTGFHVFLGENTKIFHISGDNSEVDVTSALRMGVITYSDNNFDTGTPELLFLHAPEAEPNATYLVEGGGGAYGSVGHSFAENIDLKSHPFVTEEEYADAILNYPRVADLTIPSGNEEVDVTFRVWIEGSDKDAVGSIVQQEFGIILDLYAIDED